MAFDNVGLLLCQWYFGQRCQRIPYVAVVDAVDDVRVEIKASTVRFRRRAQLGYLAEVGVGIFYTGFAQQLAQAVAASGIPEVTIGTGHKALGEGMSVLRTETILCHDVFKTLDVLAQRCL